MNAVPTYTIEPSAHYRLRTLAASKLGKAPKKGTVNIELDEMEEAILLRKAEAEGFSEYVKKVGGRRSRGEKTEDPDESKEEL